MKQTPDQPDDNRDSKLLKPAVLPQRDSVTNIQVNTLLMIGGMLQGVLILPTRSSEDEWKGRPELDGGVLAAAEATFINVCNRLDEILEDKTRWNFNSQNTLEAQLSQVYAAHVEFQKAQTAVARSLEAPHRKYNPSLIRLRDGNWAAILGDASKLDDAITGIGNTPQQALEAFDGVFTGNLPHHLIEWLKQREKEQQSNETTNTKSVVPGRSGKTDRPQTRRKAHPHRNRRGTRKNPGLRLGKIEGAEPPESSGKA